MSVLDEAEAQFQAAMALEQKKEVNLIQVTREDAYRVVRIGGEVHISLRHPSSQKKSRIVIPDIIAYRIGRRLLEETEDMRTLSDKVR